MESPLPIISNFLLDVISYNDRNTRYIIVAKNMLCIRKVFLKVMSPIATNIISISGRSNPKTNDGISPFSYLRNFDRIIPVNA